MTSPFLFGLRANPFALPSTKCNLNAFTVLSLIEMPKYHGYIPKMFFTMWSPMNHPLCFANLTWFHFGISHIVMFCSTGAESSTTVASVHFGCFSFFLPPPLTPKP